MGLFKFLWGFFFRLFPCPTPTGSYPIGTPGPKSPVIVTCNFDLTVRRIKRILKKLDVWLIVADSKGVNVWCAAGGGEFNTHSVVSAVKTSAVADKVAHRALILPPLAAPGVKAAAVSAQTGWQIAWGPVRAGDLPRFLENNFNRTESMKRVTYDLKERIDTALGTVFPIYLLGLLGFLLFGRHLLLDYLVVGAAGFFIFMSVCPWLPGKSGLMKAIFLDAILGAALLVTELLVDLTGSGIRGHLILAMVLILLIGLDLGGMSTHMNPVIEPFLAKFGIKSIGNIPIAGTVRTELLDGKRKLSYNRDICKGCRSCEEICPQGVWGLDENDRAVMVYKNKCTFCTACMLQCESGAIQAPETGSFTN
jgi:NAD-dependent dihydropyrimidine dehydrogenase PreA subunit